MNHKLRSLLRSGILIKSAVHSNVYLFLGCYGILAMIGIYFSTRWFFHASLDPAFIPSLPPAWWLQGDLNHLLGTDQQGRDIFDLLLIAYKSTLLMTLKATIAVIIISVIINYILFFIAPIRIIIQLLFRVILAIPPILSAMTISLLLDNNLSYLLMIVGLSYLPKFVHNIHEAIMKERKKTYIIAYKLDGLSNSKILNRYILPNIAPIYLTEIIALFSYILLTVTVLTFLGFGYKAHAPDLGAMMFYMVDLLPTNHWGFLAPGIIIIITIFLMNFFNIGLNSILTKYSGR